MTPLHLLAALGLACLASSVLIAKSVRDSAPSILDTVYS